MSRRIAEFDTIEDAQNFRRMKGKDYYTVCAGINLNWAVRPLETQSIDCGPYEPREAIPVAYRDPDELHDEVDA